MGRWQTMTLLQPRTLWKGYQGGLQHFCTHRLGQPRSMRGLQEPKRDHDLLRHMRRITEMLVSDAASSETGGAAEMRTMAVRPSRRPSRLSAETLPIAQGQA